MEAIVLHSVSHSISFCSHHLQALPLSCPQVQLSSNYHSQGQLYSAAQVKSRASLQVLQLVRNMDSSPTLMVPGAALLPPIGGEERQQSQLSCVHTFKDGLPESPRNRANSTAHTECRACFPALLSLVEPVLLLASVGKGKKGREGIFLTNATAWQMRALPCSCPQGWLPCNPTYRASSTMVHSTGAGPTLPSDDPTRCHTLMPFIITSGPAFLPAVGDKGQGRVSHPCHHTEDKLQLQNLLSYTHALRAGLPMP